jgi:hypothetical protein
MLTKFAGKRIRFRKKHASREYFLLNTGMQGINAVNFTAS